MKFLYCVVSAVCLALTLPEVAAQPYGLTNRVGNTTLRMPPALPVLNYSSSNAFGSLSFTGPVAIVSAPGETSRLFIVEQPGRIIVITNLASPDAHPIFRHQQLARWAAANRGCWAWPFTPAMERTVSFSSSTPSPFLGTRYDRLARFEISPNNPNQGLVNSEVILISQPDDASNHNAGDLHFGPDGYLYVALGDEGDANDTWANSQRINKDFFAGMSAPRCGQAPRQPGADSASGYRGPHQLRRSARQSVCRRHRNSTAFPSPAMSAPSFGR